MAATVLTVAILAQLGNYHDDRLATHPGFFTPLTSSDIRDWRKLLQHVDTHDAVLVPTRHNTIGGENWVIPQGEIASALPYANRRLVGDGTNRFSARFSWHDIEELCDATPAWRTNFYQTHRVRWIAMSNEAVASRPYFFVARICEHSLASLGAIYPPKFVEGRFALFEIPSEPLLTATHTRR